MTSWVRLATPLSDLRPIAHVPGSRIRWTRRQTPCITCSGRRSVVDTRPASSRADHCSSRPYCREETHPRLSVFEFVEVEKCSQTRRAEAEGTGGRLGERVEQL